MSQPLLQQHQDPYYYGHQPSYHNQQHPPAAAGYHQPAYYGQQQGYQPPLSVQYPPPQGYAPVPVLPPPSNYGSTMPQYGTGPTPSYRPAAAPVAQMGGGGGGGGGYQPGVDPYSIYELPQRHDEEGIGYEGPQYGDLPEAEAQVRGAVSKPKEVEVQSHIGWTTFLCVISLLLLLLPVIPIACIALGYSIHARKLEEKRDYDKAKKKGSKAKCCAVVAIPFTLGWLCLLIFAIPISVLMYFSHGYI